VPDLFIGGSWTGPIEPNTREIRCPADQSLVATVDEGSSLDTAAAIEAARAAFDDGTWAATTAAERGALLDRVADALERHRDEFAKAEALDTGKRIVEAEYDMDDVTSVFRYYAKLATEDDSRTINVDRSDVLSRVVHEPVGVCGLITPWNYPLLQTSWKVAPALAAGNAFVLKPSELTPSTAILLMRELDAAGLPAGVGNLVLGTGPNVGALLSTHPAVDLVSFTGGLITGRIIMKSAAETVKKVALELGGKNPNIVFADADRQAAIDNALTAVFLHSGQVCSAGARLIIEKTIHDEFVAELVRRAEAIRLGGPFDETAETGPLISAAHREKVEAYVAMGVAEGAVLRCGGRRPDDPSLAGGYFYLPTILDNCNADMGVVRDESFGPVLTIETFATERGALRLANDTNYGLAGAVWSGDDEKADRVASGMRAGTVWINDYHPYVPQAEWGGYKQSGFGRELGHHGLAEYRETKHIWRNLSPAPTQWFGGAL
jgi:betaine-aldehyde dehydrogenase